MVVGPANKGVFNRYLHGAHRPIGKTGLVGFSPKPCRDFFRRNYDDRVPRTIVDYFHGSFRNRLGPWTPNMGENRVKQFVRLHFQLR